MTRRVIITGFAPDSRKLSPVWSKAKRTGFECWSMNNDTEQYQLSQRHFEMHELEVYTTKSVDDAKPSPAYLADLHKGLGIPVYMLKADKTIPGSVAYPIKQIQKHFGGTDYFTNSISYMIALAIYERVDEIHVYGIDMALQHESAWERPSIEFFLGWASGAGIKLVIPDQSDLLKCLGLYGFEPTYEYEAIVRERLGQKRQLLVDYKHAAETQALDAAVMQGAIDDMEFLLRQWAHPGDRAFVAKSKARRQFLEKRSARYKQNAALYWKAWGRIQKADVTKPSKAKK